MFKIITIMMFLAFIILVNSNTLNAQIKFKGEPSKNKSLGSFGGINFEKELLLFNSKVPIDRNSIYYGWSTNTNIKSTGNPNAQKGGMITILGDQEFPSTFRSIGKDSRNQILSLLEALQYESLLSFDYENLEWSPSLATHWKIADDSLSYWFRLDPQARWADGEEVTSEDIIATFKLLIDDGHEDPNVSAFWNDLFEIPVAESKYIVKITAKKKDWRSFRYCSVGFTVMPSRYLNKIDGAGFIEKYDFTFMPGTGSYEYYKEMSKMGSEGFIIMKRRDNYWAKDHPTKQGLYNFDKIKFIFIEDENQQVISFFNGDYDIYPWSRAQWWVERFTSEKYNEIANGWVQKIKIFNYLPKGPSGIVFNTKNELFKDVKIRKAFSHLFDVEKLNKRLFFNEYIRLNTYFYGTPYANPRNPMMTYNPQTALELLSSAGWNRKPGDQWLTNEKNEIFEFQFLIAPSGDRIYTTFQEDLKNIGIKMEFKQVDYSAKFSQIMKKEYEVSNQGWTANFFPSPEGIMHSKFADEVEVTNITSMAYPELDALIEEYNREWDPKKRIPLAHQIDSIAINSFHYALGWTSPYGARMLYWNKFKMPESGITYIGDWRDPITHWWIDPQKENDLNDAKKNNTTLLPQPEVIDYWNRQ